MRRPITTGTDPEDGESEAAIQPVVWARATAGIASPEHSHDVLHGHDVEKVVALEVNRELTCPPVRYQFLS